MFSLTDFLYEKLTDEVAPQFNESEDSVKDEKSFRDLAKAKFEEAFGDDLDEEKMKNTIDGILDDNKDLVEKGEWAELVGILNQSFAD